MELAEFDRILEGLLQAEHTVAILQEVGEDGTPLDTEGIGASPYVIVWAMKDGEDWISRWVLGLHETPGPQELAALLSSLLLAGQRIRDVLALTGRRN